MLSINNNKITLTKGDSLTLTVDIFQGDTPYVIQQGDVIRFALGTAYKGEYNYTLVLQKTIDPDTLAFTLSTDETERLEYREYKYDIEMTHGDGTVDTFISSTFTITGEVE